MASLWSVHSSMARRWPAKATEARVMPFSSVRSFHRSATSQSELNPILQKNLAHNANISVQLNTLKPMPGSRKPERRIGRGIGSGRGKTATKGHKGRTARQGGEVAFGFEGGQTPFYKRFRKYGFTNRRHKIEYATLNLARLQFWIDTGRIDPTQKITIKTLVESGCVGRLRKLQKGIKLLGEGHDWWKTPIDIEVSQASTAALNAIKQTGGTIKLVYYNQTGMQALLHPEKYAPYTARRLPYLTIPRQNINRKLIHPMEQPDQLPGWVEAQQALQEAIRSSTSTNTL